MGVFFVMVLILVAGAVPSHGRTESEGTVFIKTQPLESMNNVTVSSSKVVSYGDLYLVMQWPKSFCNIYRIRYGLPCYPPDTDRFTVHGLWPQKIGGGIINCSDTRTNGLYPPFQLPQLNGLPLGHLNYYWRDLKRPVGLNQRFWEYEYNKHGSCTFNNQHRYFALTLKLVENFRVGNPDLISRLSRLPIDRRIIPGRLYRPFFIQNAVLSVTGKVPILHCWRIGRDVLLLELYFCADPVQEELLSCGYQSDCGNSWVFLPSS